LSAVIKGGLWNSGTDPEQIGGSSKFSEAATFQFSLCYLILIVMPPDGHDEASNSFSASAALPA